MEKQDVDETKKRAPDDEDNQKMSKKSRADASASEDPKSDIESKRAYNRLNAARHRQRQKDALAKLTEQVREKDERIKLLDRENETLKAQLQVLAAQNQQLVGSLQLFSAGQAQAQQHQQQIPMAHHNFDVRNLRDFAQQPNPLSLSQAATIDPQTLLAYQKLFQQSDAHSVSTDTTPVSNNDTNQDATNEDDKLEKKRAYNRMNAARHRKRQKTRIAELQEQVFEQDKKIETLEKENAALKAQLQLALSSQQNLASIGRMLTAVPSSNVRPVTQLLQSSSGPQLSPAALQQLAAAGLKLPFGL